MNKRAQKKSEDLITKVYRERCSGIQIDLMDLRKVSAEGHRLLAAGATEEELGDGLLKFVETIRKN